MDKATEHPVSQTDARAAARRDLRRWLLPTWQDRKRMLRRDAWRFVVLTYVLLLAAYLLPQDLRSNSAAHNFICYVLFLVRTFVWHIGLAVLLVALLAAWQRVWRLALVTLPLLAVTLGPELRHFLPKSPAPIAAEADAAELKIASPARFRQASLTVMSANLLYSNWQRDSMIQEIRQEDPDVLLLQEYTADWHHALSNALADRYPHIRQIQRPDPFGAAIYSRRPFVGEPDMHVQLGDVPVPQMRAVVRVADVRVTIYNIHLLPPYGLEYTFHTRRQLADLCDILAAEGGPVILSGDLNFTDRSPNADALHNAGLADVHVLAGQGRGSTWPVHSFFRYVPGIRLDHIYVSQQLTCTKSHTGIGRGSDHRPIVARIGLTD